MEPQFGILGPLEATVDERRLELGGPKPRRLLGALILHAGEVVSADRLVDAVWEDAPPGGAEGTLRSHVANLRRAFVEAGVGDALVTRPPGYRLVVADERIDARCFERLVTEGRAALDGGGVDRAAELLRAALGLWRGRVLDDVGAPRFAQAETARLEALRLGAVESRVDADLALGLHRELVGELEALVATHPFREHLCGQLMLALYRSGRQAEALEVCRLTRQRLDAELGLTPGQALSELETAILRHDPALAAPGERDAPTPAAGQGAPPRRRPAPPDALLDVVRRVPMVGRSAELDRLRAMWHAVAGGGRRVALVSGEAGVGKTRLVAELAAEAAEEGAEVLVGRCEQAPLVPYQPVTAALQASSAAAAAFAQAPERRRRRLAELMDRPGDAPPAEAQSGDPEEQRAAFLAAVTELVAAMATSAPLVVVVEEAERIDRASARLLRHLVAHLPERVLLVVCFRDPPGSRHAPLRELVAEVEGRGVADRVALGSLSEHELAALATAWTGAQAPRAFIRELWSSTGGNPFYAGEVVRDLVARGGIDRPDEAWHVPTGVRDVLRQRLGALSEAAQEAVRCAAVIGNEVDVGVLTQVADEADDRVADALEEAVEAGWFVETARSWELAYTFRHALMREAVHADLPARRRQRLHLRAADALEAAGLSRAVDVAAAAAHLRAAGALADRRRTADLSLRAAAEAGRMYAWDEAVGHAEAAAAILGHAGAPAEEQGQAAVRAAELLITSTVDYRRAIDHLEAAVQHYQAAGDDAAVAAVRSRLGYVLAVHHRVMDVPRALELLSAAEPALPDDGEGAFELHLAKALATMFALRTEEGCAAAAQAVGIADRLDRRDLVALARPAQASHWFHRGDLAAADRLVDEAWATAQRLGDARIGWEAVVCRALVASNYLLDPATSAAWCRRGLAQPRLDTLPIAHAGLTDQLAYALALMGEVATARAATSQLPAEALSRRLLLLLDGDGKAAERSWDEALAHDLDNGDLLNAALNACWLAHARRLLGRADDALAALGRALAIAVDGPHVPAELSARAELARLLAAAGAAGEAQAHLARCEAILAGGEDWRGQVGAVALARGAVAAARGDAELAGGHHRRAVEVFTAYRLPARRAEALEAWGGWVAAST